MTGAFADLTTVRVINPTGIAGAGGVITVLSEITGIAALLAAILAGASLVARFRSRQGDERQQIKWLAFVGAAFLAELAAHGGRRRILGHGTPPRQRLGQRDVRRDVRYARARHPGGLRGRHLEVPACTTSTS